MTGVLTIPADAYHADAIADTPTLSCSMAKLLCTASPAHARAAHPKLNPNYQRTEDDKFNVGTVAHALLLQGIDVAHVCHFNDWRTQDSKDARDLARSHGRVPLLAKHWDEVQRMVAAVNEQLAALAVQPRPFTDGQPEQTLVWEEDGVLCRSRLDWLHHDGRTVDDLKTTTRLADPAAWERTLFSMGYDVQAAFYRRGVRAVLETDPDFRLVIVETTDPYALSLVGLTPEAWELADAKVDYALALWKRCLAEDSWPGYPPRVHYVEPPAWEVMRWIERETLAKEAA